MIKNYNNNYPAVPPPTSKSNIEFYKKYNRSTIMATENKNKQAILMLY